MNAELIRIVDGIARDKNIDRDQIYTDIEQAIASGLRKQFNTEDTSEFAVQLDRATGLISATRQGAPLDLKVVGRIGAQTVKQVMIQLIRQDERGSIYEEYKDRVGTIVTGTIARFEGGTMIVTLGRVEGIMPRSEQIPGEQHQVGERIQALILEVRDTPSAVKIILSRSHPELIRRLFEREVPEVGERTIEPIVHLLVGRVDVNAGQGRCRARLADSRQLHAVWRHPARCAPSGRAVQQLDAPGPVHLDATVQS